MDRIWKQDCQTDFRMKTQLVLKMRPNGLRYELKFILRKKRFEQAKYPVGQISLIIIYSLCYRKMNLHAHDNMFCHKYNLRASTWGSHSLT